MTSQTNSDDEFEIDITYANPRPLPAATSTPQGPPVAYAPTARDSLVYNMNHRKRGLCLIFCHVTYKDPRMPQRTCAMDDALACEKAFEALGFDVGIFYNRTSDQYTEILSQVSQLDHSNHDCLSVVFMSHGTSKDGIQTLSTYDGKVKAESLWKPFRADVCSELAGKPKLFFIQACRGLEPDYGCAMRVQTDAAVRKEGDYVLPSEADILIMWAGAPGKPAFKTSRENIHGSVFIHFLTQNLLACAKLNQEYFLDIVLLQVTLQVATEFESFLPSDERKNRNKQVPQTISTLLRRVPLTPKPMNNVLETSIYGYEEVIGVYLIDPFSKRT